MQTNEKSQKNETNNMKNNETHEKQPTTYEQSEKQ